MALCSHIKFASYCVQQKLSQIKFGDVKIYKNEFNSITNVVPIILFIGIRNESKLCMKL